MNNMIKFLKKLPSTIPKNKWDLINRMKANTERLIDYHSRSLLTNLLFIIFMKDWEHSKSNKLRNLFDNIKSIFYFLSWLWSQIFRSFQDFLFYFLFQKLKKAFQCFPTKFPITFKFSWTAFYVFWSIE
jgi:hypothetical protein